MKKNQGITLIALIVTIIILIILAGISIGLISGSEGLMSKTSAALDKNDEATATEKMELKITYFNMVSYGENTRKATLQELAEGLFQDKEIDYIKIKENKIASLDKIDVTGENSIFVKLKDYPYEFEIDNNLHLASVDGVKIAKTEEIDNSANDVYAENEIEVGTWIDGKKIYRKVISFSENVSSFGNVRYMRKQFVENVNEIIDCGGYFTLAENKINFGSSEIDWNGAPSFHSYARVLSNCLEIYILYNAANYSDNPITGTVWVEYTKSI